jgi:hydrogenase maturation factor
VCRSTIARVIAVEGAVAVVEFDGVRRRASTLATPDVAVGDDVLIGLGVVLGRVAPADVAALDALARPTAGSTTPIPDPLERTHQGGT